MNHLRPVGAKTESVPSSEIIGQIELPTALADELQGPQRSNESVSLAELEKFVRRLWRENGRIRHRVSMLERLLSDQSRAGARRRELERKALMR